MTVDDGFGHWLAGFIDGEGSFNIRRNSHAGYAPVLTVGLRVDDLPLLEEIYRVTGFGMLERYKKPSARGHASARWTVASKADCLSLVDLLDRFPLRSKKARDYALWREAVVAWTSIRHFGPRPRDWSRLIALKRAMEDGRRFDPTGIAPPLPDPQLRMEDAA